MFVFLYKDICLNTNKLNPSLPSVVTSLLQDFEYVFPEDIPKGLPPIRGIEHQIDFILGLKFQTSRHIGVILRKRKNFKVG